MADLEVVGGEIRLNGEQVPRLRRWTVDAVAGDVPKLYLETVGDAELRIAGVEVFQNLTAGGLNGAAVAEWILSLDPDAVQSATLNDDSFEESMAAAMLRVIAKLAVNVQ